MAEAPTPYFNDGAAYERQMGRWSAKVGEIFLDWLALPKGLRWLDVGCGNGAFTGRIVERMAPASVEGIDPSDGQIAFAKTRPDARIASFRVGDAQSLPFPDASVDAVTMALVITFIPDRAKAASELTRVVRPGGTVATYMWDMEGGGFPMGPMMRALAAAGAPMPASFNAKASNTDELRRVWQEAGLKDVETRVIRIEANYADFDDFCASSLTGASPMSAALAKLAPDAVVRMKDDLRRTLPTNAQGRIVIPSFANAVKGRRA